MLIIAHRGAHRPETGGVEENTVAAFCRAVEQGVDGVEFDVRATRDGQLVVHHDARLIDGRPVAATDAVDLPAHVPSFAAVLDACQPLRVVNVELKNHPFEPGFDPTGELPGRVGALLAGRPAGAFLLSSFHLPSLEAARAAAPGLATGWLTAAGYDQLAAVEAIAAAGHRALCPAEEVVTGDLVMRAHRAGLEIWAWTVNDTARMAELAAAGVDALITDRPWAALAERG